MALKRTALYESHKKIGGKLVPFAGYEMPIQYKAGIVNEHKVVRTSVGVFDVSHMGQIEIKGEGVAEFFSKITPTDFRDIPSTMCKYTVLLNEDGGIIDDLIITKFSDTYFFAVINAACKEKDINWIQSNLPSNLDLVHLEKRSLLAVQGPKAQEILQKMVDTDLAGLKYMHCATAEYKGTPILVSRTGYTGEDGFEVSIPGANAAEFFEEILSFDGVEPAGLGSRDILRLEMGYPLYGNDMDEDTSPIEASLGWVVSKTNSGYIGEDTVVKHKAEGATIKRIGLRFKDRVVARSDAEIYSGDKKVGIVTSGAFSPSLKQSIAIASIDSTLAKIGESVEVDVRGKRYEAEIVRMPFLQVEKKAAA